MIELNATISGINGNLTIQVDRRNKISINCKYASRSDNSRPSFGIISNSGMIQLRDTNGQIEEYANKKWLASGLPVEIILRDTLYKIREVVCTMKTSNWQYDSDNKIVDINIKDDLEDWQSIKENRINLRSEATAYELFQILRHKTPSKYEFENLDEAVEDYLMSIIVRFPYMESGSLWSQWNKFCEAFGIYMFKNTRNKIECVYDL